LTKLSSQKGVFSRHGVKSLSVGTLPQPMFGAERTHNTP